MKSPKGSLGLKKLGIMDFIHMPPMAVFFFPYLNHNRRNY